MKIRNAKDFSAGLLFILFGAGFVVVARNYPMGTAVRMGPAYFPTVLGAILVLLGGFVAGRAFWIDGPRLVLGGLRALVFVLGSMLAFAFLLQPLGLVLTTVALVVLSRLGGWEFRVTEVLILALVLAALAVVLFVSGLGLLLKIWP